MEKSQSDLCLEVLSRFHKAGILDNFILIGSWCVFFYKDYFKKIPYIKNMVIRTRDLDILIDKPSNIKKKVDIPELLEDLGFLIDYKGSKGYIKLDHPELILEFLVPEKGRGTEKPYPLPGLGVNATALRFLDFLSLNTIKVKFKNTNITLPHPANFALHKLIIFQRRKTEEKALKDKYSAVQILKALIEIKEIDTIQKVLQSIPNKWRSKIKKGLEEAQEFDLLTDLKL